METKINFRFTHLANGIMVHMSKPLIKILGKAIKQVASIRGGGSALPGLFVERIYPDFIKETLSSLPMGVVVISGTNGKTTTTKMVVQLLESQGLKVFTNRTGSNFTRGVAAALLGDIDMKGHLHADIAVLELDEAHAVHFVDKIPPQFCLLLNVMRDQLDRFGEIDHTASLLRHIAEKTNKKVVLNREDIRVAGIAKSIDEEKVSFFGLDDSLRQLFPSDDNLHGNKDSQKTQIKSNVTLLQFSDNSAVFNIKGKIIHTELKLNGIYNVFNAAAAMCLVDEIVGDKLNLDKLIQSLASIEPAFGRGEVLIVNGKKLELVLVKNPSGFRLGLKSFDPASTETMIAINDNYADGRDMSWLWDVDFSSLKENGVSVVSGIRAYDMAQRLQYDETTVGIVETDLKKALKIFISNNKAKTKRIYCTYTAMISIRKLLSKITKVEVVR